MRQPEEILLAVLLLSVAAAAAPKDASITGAEPCLLMMGCNAELVVTVFLGI
jgi:hypothetical protein